MRAADPRITSVISTARIEIAHSITVVWVNDIFLRCIWGAGVIGVKETKINFAVCLRVVINLNPDFNSEIRCGFAGEKRRYGSGRSGKT